MNPGPTHFGHNTDFCGNGMKPTLCDDNLRTFGKQNGKWPACGSTEDRWRSTPWRAPGSAPVLDACEWFPTPIFTTMAYRWSMVGRGCEAMSLSFTPWRP
jgi:hypothetical protein